MISPRIGTHLVKTCDLFVKVCTVSVFGLKLEKYNLELKFIIIIKFYKFIISKNKFINVYIYGQIISI